MVRVDDTVGGR